jgi:hypothetical protein
MAIVVFHGISDRIEHPTFVPHSRAVQICNMLNPDEVHFDDGFVSAVSTIVYLAEMGFKVKAFVPVGLMGQWFGGNIGFFPQRVISESDVVTLSLMHGVTIGSHGVFHRDMSGLPVEVVKEELVVSKKELERLTGKEVQDFVWPFAPPLDTERLELGRVVYSRCFGNEAAARHTEVRNPVSSTHVKTEKGEVRIESFEAWRSGQDSGQCCSYEGNSRH